MSTNIHFKATRKIVVKKTKKRDIQTIYFNEWQTPTRVTYEIIRSKNPIQAYKDWVLTECSRDEKLPVYADDDFLQERDPVRIEVYNAGKEHVAQFEEWIREAEEQGYTVEAEAW